MLDSPLTYGNPLLLTAGELHPFWSAVGLVGFGQLTNEAMSVGLHCRLDNLANGHVALIVAIGDVVRNARVEQDRLLAHEANLAAQTTQAHRVQIHSVQLDATRVRIVEALQQANNSRFTFPKKKKNALNTNKSNSN